MEGLHTPRLGQRKIRLVLLAHSKPGKLPLAACAPFSHPDYHRRLRNRTGIHLHS